MKTAARSANEKLSLSQPTVMHTFFDREALVSKAGANNPHALPARRWGTRVGILLPLLAPSPTSRDVRVGFAQDLLNVLDQITKAGAGFKSLADSWADTTTAHGRLMLTVLGGLAEFERELIKARTGEGRARAKAAGVHMGRPPKLTPHQRREAIARRDAGEALTDLARSYDVSHSTISRL